MVQTLPSAESTARRTTCDLSCAARDNAISPLTQGLIPMKQARLKIGERSVCERCGQDIEWHGRNYGWRDRGNNRECPPYPNKDGEIVRPSDFLRHYPNRL